MGKNRKIKHIVNAKSVHLKYLYQNRHEKYFPLCFFVNNGGANADKITVYTLLNAALNNGANLANAITLLPNPTIDDLTIRTDLKWISAELIDINGRICRSIPSSEKKISTLELESGVYFLRFILDQQQAVFKKFVKL